MGIGWLAAGASLAVSQMAIASLHRLDPNDQPADCGQELSLASAVCGTASGCERSVTGRQT